MGNSINWICLAYDWHSLGMELEVGLCETGEEGGKQIGAQCERSGSFAKENVNLCCGGCQEERSG